MFILLINCPFDDVISESQRKGTAVLGDGEIFAGLLTEVVATGAGICDKGLTRRLNRVAVAEISFAKSYFHLHFYGVIRISYYFCNKNTKKHEKDLVLRTMSIHLSPVDGEGNPKAPPERLFR